MTILCTLIFWSGIALLAHTYVLYPFVLSRLARGRALPSDRFERDEEMPEVAVLMAVYNEERVLEATLASILASEYPADRLSLWIGSDGSTDGTHAIVEGFRREHPGIRLRVVAGRNGKIRTVNALAEEAAASLEDPEKAVFVLCDANVAWTPPALRRMVRHFKRDEVGLVACQVRDARSSREGIGDEEEAYIGVENQTKYAEGVLWGRLMGAFGACYALRARLFRPVPETYIVDDFFQTMACLESGAEAIVDLEAVCHEAVSSEIAEEFRRKRRIATGNFQNLAHFRRLLLPPRGDALTAFAFWSHKGLRWIGPLLLLATMLSCLALAFASGFYALCALGFAASFLGAGLDHLLARRGGPHFKPLRFLRYFYAMNAAMLLGLVAYLRGVRSSVWEPTQRVAEGAAELPGKAEHSPRGAGSSRTLPVTAARPEDAAADAEAPKPGSGKRPEPQTFAP